VPGRIQGHPAGYGFLVPDGTTAQDVFLSRRGIRPAMQGDRALVRVVSHGRGGRREGEVVKVLERGQKRLVGVYRRGTRTSCLVPHDKRISYPMTIPRYAGGGARDKDLVAAEITRYPTSCSDLEGSVVAVLGAAGDPQVETDAVIFTYDLPTDFPPAVQAEAARAPADVPAHAFSGRLDLRHLPIVTIDGENARDFDDAVAIEPIRSGGVRLTVAVADVAAYVHAGSALDREAQSRGTSVYFPDRVIPMLPETLSNGICSLGPGVDRLAKVVRLDFSARGKPGRASFAEAVIRSAARLTYTDVTRVLVDRDREIRTRYGALVEPLERMQDLCRKLLERRRARGSIDLDLPEAEIVLGPGGNPENIVRAERTIAHRVIEEFMLAANEAVARHITARRLPMLYRVHEPPAGDAIRELATFLEGFGLRLAVDGGSPTPRAYQQVIEAVTGKPEEQLVNRVLLRSMTQARYAAENLGHFGLATDCYTHFTSPIRRYPDLVVHRVLATTLGPSLTEDARERFEAALPAIAEEASRRERIAMDAEREAVALKKAQFMQGKIGESFAGSVSDVTSFGFFVALDDHFVEGLVHVSTLTDDFYEHLERAHCLRGRRRRRTIRVGNRVSVRVRGVSIERRQIDLVLESP